MDEKDLSSKVMDHLGLVAGMYDELGIGEKIDSLIPQDSDKRLVSVGTLCKALVLNGLGFVERRLYMVSSFFENKPIGSLLGEGVEASQLNDSVLGRCLDDISAYGTTELYAHLAPNICARLNLTGRFAHLDSTSFHLDGEYNSGTPPEEGSKTIHLTKGYSRDHRPDLNQVVLSMITENQAGIPIQMEALSGNNSDKTSFARTVGEHVNSLQNVTGFEYLVMDSAGYTAGMVSEHSGRLKWISRVPESLKSCREAISSGVELAVLDEKHQCRAFETEYADVRQRWLLVRSEDAFKREVKTLNKNCLKKGAEETKAWESLCRQDFSCHSDAEQALMNFKGKCKFIDLEDTSIATIPKYSSKGRPPKGRTPDYFHYQVRGSVCSSVALYEKKKNTKGKFIIATNELSQKKLSNQELLKAYKGQSKVERGFRFMKDPQFVARNFFVSKPERVEALLFIMTLCLTIYAALEYRLRSRLEQKKEDIPNQLNKPTRKPTMRWVFALFRGIHFLYIADNQPICLNFKEVHSKIINLLGDEYKKYYLRL